MPTGKSSRPASNWHGLLYVFVIAAGLYLSSFVDASHALVSINGTLTKSFSSIIPESAKTISEAELSPTDTKLTEIKIQVNVRVVASELSVQKYGSRPAGTVTDAPGDVYRYMSISFTNLDDSSIQSASIKFKVGEDWLTDNSIDASNVALYRYANGAWAKLQTAKTGEDTLYAYYEAVTPGFSYFAIGGETAASTTTTTIVPSGATTTTAPSAATTTTPSAGAGAPGDYTIIIFVIVLIAAVVVVFWKFKIVKF